MMYSFHVCQHDCLSLEHAEDLMFSTTLVSLLCNIFSLLFSLILRHLMNIQTDNYYKNTGNKKREV